MNIVAEHLSSDSEMASSPPFPFSRLTSETLYGTATQISTKAAVTSFLEAFPANHSPTPANAPEPMMSATCGLPPSSAFGLYDPVTRFWKTYWDCSLPGILEPSSVTWPRAGITCAGVAYRQPKQERRISEIGSGWSLPTPAAQEPGWTIDGTVEVVDKNGNPPEHHNQRFYDKRTGRIVQKGLTQVVQMFPTLVVPNGGRQHNLDNLTLEGRTLYRKDGSKAQMDLETHVRLWPASTQVARKFATPQARDHRTGEAHRWDNPERSRNLNDQIAAETAKMYPTPRVSDGNGSKVQPGKQGGLGLNQQLGGKLNPDWVEFLMGWPIGWTSLDPLPAAAWEKWWTDEEWWAHDPAENEGEDYVPRLTGKSADRVKRITALGNGQVPACAAAAWLLLAEDEPLDDEMDEDDFAGFEDF